MVSVATRSEPNGASVKVLPEGEKRNRRTVLRCRNGREGLMGPEQGWEGLEKRSENKTTLELISRTGRAGVGGGREEKEREKRESGRGKRRTGQRDETA